MTRHLDTLARRLEDDPLFLACPLKLYAESEGLVDDKLAGALGCTRDALVLLRLCRAPTDEAGRFQKGIEEISARFQVDADLLAEAVRRGQAIYQLRRPGAPRGMLAAARDHEPRKDNRIEPDATPLSPPSQGGGDHEARKDNRIVPGGEA